jgi:hypothetical protein
MAQERGPVAAAVLTYMEDKREIDSGVTLLHSQLGQIARKQRDRAPAARLAEHVAPFQRPSAPACPVAAPCRNRGRAGRTCVSAASFPWSSRQAVTLSMLLV